MPERPYDETEARKCYIWRHFSDVVRPHQCIPHPDAVEAALPPAYRDIFRRFMIAVSADDSTFLLSPDAASIIEQTRQDIETALFDSHTAGHKFEIHRCPQCDRILQSPKSQQCLWCGHDWH